MRRTLVAAAAALFTLVPAAFADDGKTPAPPAPKAPPAPPAPAAPTAPAPADAAPKHTANKVSDAAKAALDKIAALTNTPVAKGMKEAAGTIDFEMMGQPLSMSFTFKAPSEIHVEPSEEMKAMPFAKAMTGGAARTLRSGFGVIHNDEYDADVAKKDGADVLTIVNYKDGVEEYTSELTLDANGLPAKLETSMKGQTGKSEGQMTWSKAGDAWRLDKLETTLGARPGGGGGRQGGGMGGGGGAGGGKIVISLNYTDAGKFAIVTSWSTEVQAMGMVYDSRITDLVVDGKKIDTAAKPSEPAKPTEPVKPAEPTKPAEPPK
jgi:hypothetical protein